MSNPSYKIKLHNLRQSKNYLEPIPPSLSTKKSYKTSVLLAKKVADKVKDKVTINRQSRYKQFLKETMPYTELESSFRTKGKQKLLEGQSTRTKRFGAGMLKEIKRKMMKHIPGRLKRTY